MVDTSLCSRCLPADALMPLVAAQPGIWVADQISPYGNAYLVAHYIEINGAIDKACLLRSIACGLAEIDVLKFRFAEQEGALVQWYDESLPLFSPEYIDLGDHINPEAVAHTLMQEDLNSEVLINDKMPLYCHLLIQLSPTRWFWYQRYHHILVDGFSFAAITRRIAEIYNKLIHGEFYGPSPFMPFKAVVDEYQAYYQSPAYAQDAAFWREKVLHLPEPATISNQALTASVPSPHIHRLMQNCCAAELKRLATYAQKQKLSLVDIALALVAVWVARLSGQFCFSAGFIFMRRSGAALCSCGPVINVLPIEMSFDANLSLIDAAISIQQELKTLRRHQRYDAENIARDLGRVGGEAQYGTVFNVKLFDYQLDFNGVAAVTHHLASGPVRDMEIALFLDETDGLTVELLANVERYQPEELTLHLQRLPQLLAQFAANPELPVGDAEMLTVQEHALLSWVNTTAHPLSEHTLSSLLAQQAARTPKAMALCDSQWDFTYQEMRDQVKALARQLVLHDIQAGDVVAVALPRSVFLALALMAIVEVGASYLPLDTEYPDERLKMMIADASPRLIITTSAEQARFIDSCSVLLYETLLPMQHAQDINVPAPTPDHPAYLIFTSGSTGRPKGVVIGHRAIVNRLLWMQHQYPLMADDVVLQKTPSSFDVSVWEFFWPLIVGAKLVMAPPKAHRDPLQLQQLIADYHVTTLHFVPSMLATFVAQLSEEDVVCCQTLRRVFCSGEALATALCRKWEKLVAVPLYNLYGPTEAAVDVSWYPAYGEKLAAVTGATVPIGLPVWNTRLRILDARLRPVPIGIAGDLYLTGVQLAQGYIGRPDLTASRFVADPYGNGERMYRTGDVARWLPDGSVEYLGRSDDQLKIRGQRIELSDIDSALLALPGVHQAVAHALVLSEAANQSDADERQLVGYLVAELGCELDVEALREQLAQRLPPHMVPVALVQLAQLPLSANGKLDRKALPVPAMAPKLTGRKPKPGLETAIADAYARLLGHEQISADDDFFALGGHSLLAMRLVAELRNELAIAVSIGQVMVAPKVEQLALLLAQDCTQEEAERFGFERALPLRKGEGPTLFCFHPASGFAWQFSVLARYLDSRWGLVGIQSPYPDGPLTYCNEIEQIYEDHLQTLLQLQPEGPYYLLGYSLGGTLAQGVAALLHARGEEVAFVGLLDTYPAETKDWNKDRDDIDTAVQREREQFLAISQVAEVKEEQGNLTGLFHDIDMNYKSSVRLLQETCTPPYQGHVTLFAAMRTLQEGFDVRHEWAKYVNSLTIYELDCSHGDIISPHSFQILGPLLNRILAGV